MEKLEYLLQELDPWEVKLQQCNKRAKLKMMKEMKSYEEECRRKEVTNYTLSIVHLCVPYVLTYYYHLYCENSNANL